MRDPISLSGSFAELVAGVTSPSFGPVPVTGGQAAMSLPAPQPHAAVPSPHIVETHGTTVIAVKYRDGVLNVGDRRATAAMSVMYDRAEKVVPLDDFTLIAISGSFARAMEIIR